MEIFSVKEARQSEIQWLAKNVLPLFPIVARLQQDGFYF